jgi:RNA polymerase sigma factor (sigma-70 family)
MTRSESQDERDVSLMAFDQYMRQVRRTEPLTEEEEALMVQRVEWGKQERSQPCPNQWVLNLARHARDRLVEVYQPLVIAIAKKYVWAFESMTLLDLVQEGNIGLMRAIEVNDPGKGFPLRSLAGRCISQAIWRAMVRYDRPVSAYHGLVDAWARLRRVRQRLEVRLNREPTNGEVAAEMGIAEEKVATLLEVGGSTCVSLQGLLEEGDAEERIDFAGLYQAQVAQDQARQGELEQAVQRALETVLTPRQREVVQLHYGLGEASEVLSFRGIGERLGMRPSAADHHERLARKKLVRALAPVCRTAQDETCA